MYELINGFATPQFCSFKLLLFPFVIDYKEPKLAQSAQIDQLFQLLNLIILLQILCIYDEVLHAGISCMLMSKTLNNDISKDLPIPGIYTM